MKVYRLNQTGQHHVRQFVQNYGRDGLIADAWFADCENIADDAFEREIIACIEIGSIYSHDGKPHTLALEEAWFDSKEVAA